MDFAKGAELGYHFMCLFVFHLQAARRYGWVVLGRFRGV